MAQGAVISLAIEVDDVRHAFGQVVALDGVSLQVEAGSVVGLLGPNGAGKTTLVRIIATLLRPDSGVARVAGIDVGIDPATVRSLIGLAGQFAAVDELLTGRENLTIVGRLYQLSNEEADRRAQQTLERMGLTDAGDRMVKTYSGGMRRRLDLGASLVGEPQVLLLDEPTTGLDPRSRIDVWDFLRTLVAEGTTVLLTTQYLEEADELADHVAVIDHGRIIAEGTPDELKRRIGGDVLIVTPVDEAGLEAMARLVEAHGSGVVHIDNKLGRVSVPVPDRVNSLLAVAQAAQEQGIELQDLEVHRPSLDDVFLELTGDVAE